MLLMMHMCTSSCLCVCVCMSLGTSLCPVATSTVTGVLYLSVGNKEMLVVQEIHDA